MQIDMRLTQDELFKMFGASIPVAALRYLTTDSPSIPIEDVRSNLRIMSECYRQGVRAGRESIAEQLEMMARDIWNRRA